MQEIHQHQHQHHYVSIRVLNYIKKNTPCVLKFPQNKTPVFYIFTIQHEI